MKRYGKKRVPGCYCEPNFSCGPCLSAGVITVPAVHAEPQKKDKHAENN